MGQSLFIGLYLTLLVIEFLTLYTLTILNINSVIKNRDRVPDIFKDTISENDYHRSIKYTVKKEHFSIFNMVFSTLTTLLILFSGILGDLESFIYTFADNKIIVGLLFLGAVSVLLGILQLPISIYSTFVIEEEFGFNKMTIKSFISDILKNSIVIVIIGGILITALFLFMDKTGGLWWLWASIFYVCFQLLMVIIYPNFIAPLFNKFTPLEDGELKDKLEVMAKKANFSLTGIFVMDGSKRSGHSNAYFTGIGKSKRIVLFDTLIDSLTIDELCGVLAHEIGHWKRGHITKRLLLTIVTVPVMFFILSLVINYEPLFTTFNMHPGTYHGLLLLISMISGTFTFYISPISNMFSRKHEFEADSFAVELTNESMYLIGALLKLSKNNLSNLTPNRYYSAFHYSHPPVSERVEVLQNLKSKG